MIRRSGLVIGVTVIATTFFVTGCSFVFHKRSPKDVRKIGELESEVSRLNRELDQLASIKRDLDRRLKSEIEKGEIGLEVGDRGITITSLAEVYFDSGKAKIRPEAEGILKKISGAIKELSGGRKVSVEGHTDNQPIKYSGWKSNQELSEARAGSVANFLTKQEISSSLISSSGYADTRPVASNDTKEGRQKNRRVEIIILSKETKRPKQSYTWGSKDTVK
ncbi:MAG: OmpA family protein [Candidatus Omnitrophica bacterium]|nr:OmpA family protein [Candidatus Omnitrophota bacterium]